MKLSKADLTNATARKAGDMVEKYKANVPGASELHLYSRQYAAVVDCAQRVAKRDGKKFDGRVIYQDVEIKEFKG